MEFELNEEQKMLQEAVRNFCQKEIAPLVNEAEKTSHFPAQLFSQMGDLGYLCLSYPSQYGGAGMGKIGDCIVTEEVAYQSMGFAAAFLVQGGIGTAAINRHGTEEQKQKYLVPSVKGKKIASFGLTEPNAGSDAASIQTTATKRNGKYYINGTKVFITNGTISDFTVVAAYTDKTKGSRGGMSLFIVDKDAPGFKKTKQYKFCARSSEIAELNFEDCEVSPEQIIGEEGKGFSYVIESLTGGRINHAARSVGLARAAYDNALAYGMSRVQFGQPVATFQANAFKLARMATQIEIARWTLYRAAWMYDHGKPHFKEAAMAKLFASEVAVYCSEEGLQINGGYGLMEDSVAQRYFRDARLGTVTEGTSEIQLRIIARELGIKTN
jgi:alkylation response protein AidB-like acyl-CoA dehydrogenase